MNQSIKIMLILFFLAFSFCKAQSNIEANELVRFLKGEWQNVTVSIKDGAPVKINKYTETMKVKSANAIAITAHGYNKG